MRMQTHLFPSRGMMHFGNLGVGNRIRFGCAHAFIWLTGRVSGRERIFVWLPGLGQLHLVCRLGRGLASNWTRAGRWVRQLCGVSASLNAMPGCSGRFIWLVAWSACIWLAGLHFASGRTPVLFGWRVWARFIWLAGLGVAWPAGGRAGRRACPLCGVRAPLRVYLVSWLGVFGYRVWGIWLPGLGIWLAGCCIWLAGAVP